MNCIHSSVINVDYRGPLGVIVMDARTEDITITHGMRFAQMVVAPVVQTSFAFVEHLAPTLGGAGGSGTE